MTDTPASQPEPAIYALHGADPEVQAYAMAKYSRSSLSMRDVISELNKDKASEFLNTFYFSYGHRSIADLAHAPFALENISMLAAVEVLDEQKWDGQERSTRYQDFSKRLHYIPDDLTTTERSHYEDSVTHLFDNYGNLHAFAVTRLMELHPRPDAMAEDAYKRTIKARAFDIARYWLPMATMTSVGQVVSARTLEEQVARLAASEYAEVRIVAEQLRTAASSPAFNVNRAKIETLLDCVLPKVPLSPEMVEEHKVWLAQVRELRDLVLAPVAVAPTLVKYSEPNKYLIESRKMARILAEEVMGDTSVEGDHTALVQLVNFKSFNAQPLLEVAATMIYGVTNYPMEQIIRMFATFPLSKAAYIVDAIMALRGTHDGLLPALRTGATFCFDIEMDIGGYRDMHRHRRCTQVAQPYSAASFACPEMWGLADPQHRKEYKEAMNRVAISHRVMSDLRLLRGASTDVADYLLPLAARKRFLMKMDLAEACYIAELRTQVAGHISYRRVAWGIYLEIAAQYPSVAKYLRVTDPNQASDPLNR